MDTIDRRLAVIQERLQRDRAAGVPERRPPPEAAATSSRQSPRSDEQLTRERRAEMWAAIKQHAPELARWMTELRGHGFTFEVTALRIKDYPGADHGPEQRPFNAICLEAQLPPLKNKSSPRSVDESQGSPLELPLRLVWHEL